MFVTRIADAMDIAREEVDIDAPLSDHGWEYPTIARLSRQLARG